MNNFNDFKLAVESLSGGKNTVKLDDINMPSVMVVIPKMQYADIMAGGPQETLPAFIVDGQEIDKIFVSKFQNIVINDRAYSLPGEDPRVYINHDEAVRVCRNKGKGYHVMTNALWAAIQSWCYKNGTVPHGNTLYGKDNNNPHERGLVTYKYESGGKHYDGRTATGSGPKTWYHDHTESGIADLCGNIWEWTTGFRLVDGEIQVIPYANAMKADCDLGASSTEWKAILPDGSLVAPGTSGTLKLDRENGSSGIRLNTSVEFPTKDSEYSYKQFGTIQAKSGIVIPNIVKALGIMPIGDYEYGNGMGYLRTHGERVAFRGSAWSYGSGGGVAAWYLDSPRSCSGNNVGFRSALYEN